MSKQQDTKLTPQILAMYLGCKILKEDQQCLLYIVENDGLCQLYWPDDEPEWYPVAECKPILRRLEDMTEEEADYIMDNYYFKGIDFDMDKIKMSVNVANRLVQQVPVMIHLLSKGFDLFGLIDAGMAIDAKTLKG